MTVLRVKHSESNFYNSCFDSDTVLFDVFSNHLQCSKKKENGEKWLQEKVSPDLALPVCDVRPTNHQPHWCRAGRWNWKPFRGRRWAVGPSGTVTTVIWRFRVPSSEFRVPSTLLTRLVGVWIRCWVVGGIDCCSLSFFSQISSHNFFFFLVTFKFHCWWSKDEVLFISRREKKKVVQILMQRWRDSSMCVLHKLGATKTSHVLF